MMVLGLDEPIMGTLHDRSFWRFFRGQISALQSWAYPSFREQKQRKKKPGKEPILFNPLEILFVGYPIWLKSSLIIP